MLGEDFVEKVDVEFYWKNRDSGDVEIGVLPQSLHPEGGTATGCYTWGGEASFGGSVVPVAALKFRSVDLQSPRNNQEHHTQEMGLKRLVVRRGQSFLLQLHFSRPFHFGTDYLTFVAETGPAPTELLGTRATFSLTQARQGNVWSASDFTIDTNSLFVSLFTPSNAVIGPYTLKIEISQGQGHSVTHPLGTFILLFNPWNAEDDVYLPSEILLQEYIMMDYGFVYKGHERFITSWPWNYGQFEEDIIDICFEILNKSLYFLENPSKDYSQRNDPVYVCRVVSAMINSNDDNGVLQGNWGEDYSRGVSPLEWNGSVAILRQWLARGRQPVKYGQCWVFAAVMCTVMRCLGVPTRVVSNFRSAHNMDRNLTVDTYYDQNAEMLPTQKRDKIWNFHVWNECWMIRKDLPPGYNGWQVLDPTPQQTSSGIFCCGPASVKAIREGEVHLPYDTPFVYAEVNADEVIWLFRDGQAQEILDHNTHSIGKEISTKMVGSAKRQNITSSYKYPEGSPEERSVFMKASQKMLGPGRASSPFLDLLGSRGSQDQPAQLQLHLARTPEWGQDLLLKLHALRVPDRVHPRGPIRLVVHFCAQALLHQGGTREPLWRQTVHLNLDFGEEIQWPLLLPYDNYRNKLTDEKLIRVSGIAKVEDMGRSMLVLKDISLEPPNLSIEVSKRAEVGKALRVHITLTNTLMTALSNCMMVLEGSGLIDGQISKNIGTLVAGHTIHIQLDLYPIKTGPRQLQVLISSNEIKEIKGYKDIFVAAARVSSAPPRPAPPRTLPTTPLPSLPEPSTLPTAPLFIP
ncbi:protein-glutamine gamma-glutamyltransferase Z [Lynx canadensis]|uniref:protein-glutamine gamma-glutamyltransferase Z n=1 Tax=Lynx canadensis TaxID=61383 RepID=UPI0011B07E9B|nr:protein-glutamine gamma-glutamyltransferase Z [Lynx canadensis]